ncbi:unnamed protein product [Urochloa humidicola]
MTYRSHQRLRTRSTIHYYCRDEDDTLLFQIQISECIFACIISQQREGDYRNGAKVAFRHLHSGLKRIIHENSRSITIAVAVMPGHLQDMEMLG